MAENAQKKLQAITSEDIVGELIDLEIGVSGISMMTVNKEMVLQKTVYAGGNICLPRPIPWLWPLLTHRQPDGRGQCKIQDSCSQRCRPCGAGRGCEKAGRQIYHLGQDQKQSERGLSGQIPDCFLT